MADVSDVTFTPLSSFIESNPAVLIVVSDQVDENGTPVDLGDFANKGLVTKCPFTIATPTATTIPG